MSDAFSSSCHDSTNCSVAGGHAVTKSVKSQNPTSSFDIASTHEFHENLHAEDRPQEECGVFGIFAPGIDVARRAFFGIFALQHRGQESAGIAVSDGQKMQLHTDMGLVTQIFNEDILSGLNGDIAVAHTRYSTTGSSELCNAQPIFTESSEGKMALAHNGNLVNAGTMRESLEKLGRPFTTSMDTEVIGKVLELLNERPMEEALLETMRRVQGAYSLVMMTNDSLIALRDPNGVRPLCLGVLREHRHDHDDSDNSRPLNDGALGYVVASETCALNVAGAEFVREIEPGEIVFITRDGVESVFFKEESKEHDNRSALCIFEFIYLARPDSYLLNKNVHHARRRMGELLADQAPVEADVVIGVPDSGLPAAIGYATGSGIPYQEGLIKNRYIARTFIQPDQTQRELGVRMKLTPLRDVLEGKRVVVVEDSIVRGTTTKRIVQMIREAGATEVHLRISSPPYQWPCFYGIDTAARKDLIAYQRSVEEIRQYNGADSLAYITMDNLIEAVGHPKDHFCRACFDGEYPIYIPQDVRYTKLVLGEGENGTNGHAKNGNSTLEAKLADGTAHGPANNGGGDPGPESEGEWLIENDELVATS
jgi:amidophosphoribosyltransferase